MNLSILKRVTAQKNTGTCGDNVEHYTQRVVLQMEWDVPADDDHVEWEMWTSSEDWYGAEFKLEFARVARELEDSTTFTPHYLHFDGKLLTLLYISLISSSGLMN